MGNVDITAFTTLEPETKVLTGCVSGSVQGVNINIDASSGLDLDKKCSFQHWLRCSLD